MRHIYLRRWIAFLMSMVFLLSGFSAGAAPVDSEAEFVREETQAEQTIAQRIQDLKAQIQSLPTTGGEKNARVDLTGFAPSAKEMETPVLDSHTKLYHSLNLASDISLNYVVSKSDLEGADSFYLQCEVPLYENNLQAGSKTLILQPVEKSGFYYFTLDGLTAVQMNDVIRATLYMTKDGQALCSETDSYSIAQ